jgi:hypothetical protein
MNSIKIGLRLGVALCALGLFAKGAMAQSATTPVNISSYTTNTWSFGSAGATSGNQSTGITFGDWADKNDKITTTNTVINFTPTLLGANPEVYTLIQEVDGGTYGNPTITFTNSLGQTDAFTLVDTKTLRGVYLPGGGLSGSANGVTAESWLQTGGNYLDEQTFTLPTSWAGTSLDSMKVTLNGITGVYLSGVDTEESGPPPSSVPEPASLAMLAIGCLGFAAVRRRQAA